MLAILIEFIVGGLSALALLWFSTFIHRLVSDNRHENTLRNIDVLERDVWPDLPKELRWNAEELFDGEKDPLLYFDRDEGYLQRPGTVIELPRSTMPVLTNFNALGLVGSGTMVSFFNGAKVLGKDHPYSLEIEDMPGVYYGKIVMGA